MFSGVVKNDFIALFNADIFVEHSKTNLWTLKILKDCDWLADLCRCLANPCNLIVTLTVVTMTKVKTEAVNASKR
ncbi:hypothetical protein D3C85_1571150 [compost metagenome]